MKTKKETQAYKDLETITVLALAALGFGLILKLDILLYASLCLLFTGVFLKNLSSKIACVWLKFAEVLGKVNSRIILTLVFYLVLTPIAFLHRIAKGDFMNIRRRETKPPTYWTTREHTFVAKDLENLW